MLILDYLFHNINDKIFISMAYTYIEKVIVMQKTHKHRDFNILINISKCFNAAK